MEEIKAKYNETLKDSTPFKVKWIYHEESYGRTNFQEIKIKILNIADDHLLSRGDLSQPVSHDDEAASAVITIQAYLTTGIPRTSRPITVTDWMIYPSNDIVISVSFPEVIPYFQAVVQSSHHEATKN
ncbi:hypothetical protein ACROYT_G021766 [Oculina patagonica]